MRTNDQFLSGAYAYDAVMELSEYFDTHPIGALVQGGYDGNDDPRLEEGDDVYDCKRCSSLVRSSSRTSHATEHELVSALLHQLTLISHSHSTT